MSTAQSYTSEIKARLAASPVVATLNIVNERTIRDRGYFRARMSLINGDFLEVSEYFVVENDQPSTIEYRYQWMDSGQRNLIKRWDNAEHYPDLPDFPHHIHVGSDKGVSFIIHTCVRITSRFRISSRPCVRRAKALPQFMKVH